jgi:K+-transporting ATPase ATPase A chain
LKEKIILQPLKGKNRCFQRSGSRFCAIKHLGTNGGGFFGANSAHPLENPNYITNMTEMVTQMIIPFALVFALGFI